MNEKDSVKDLIVAANNLIAKLFKKIEELVAENESLRNEIIQLKSDAQYERENNHKTPDWI